ncbi:hypothetical protein MB84_05985 [Pandoraea oxalativorans]|uniref:Peptidase A2 domain-containing protein n=1 Tax=Pandoraea oxalativorans TaxID=573737 RepID=A0A0E3YBA4_9BURK|nr:hypothetical protein MB84_05985 [Pandoraea oxalativorans]
MKALHRIRRIVWVAVAALAIFGAARAHARVHQCSAAWPEVAPVFAATVQYGDPEQKTDPYIDVLVNDRSAKMLLDTGSNAHVLWDTRLLDSASLPTGESLQTLDAIASATKASNVMLSLTDGANRQHLQRFYVIDETPLMALGYSGIVSPQFLAQEKVSLIDFKDDCFFVSERFDPGGAGRYRLDVLGEIPNPHRVMAIPLGVRGDGFP